MRLVTVIVLCLLASCKPIVRQEEPTSKEEFAVVVRIILKSISHSTKGSKAAVRTMAKGIEKQKSYEALVSQLQDIGREVIKVREGYVNGVMQKGGRPAAYQVETLKSRSNANYRKWAAEIARGMQEALDANKLYNPKQPDLRTGRLKTGGLTGGYRPETMSDIMRDAKQVLNALESPLEF